MDTPYHQLRQDRDASSATSVGLAAIGGRWCPDAVMLPMAIFATVSVL
jgi:hypothetical protein